MAMTDLEKLRRLLPHWMEHNAEHAAEFRTWAERARAEGQDEAANGINGAADKLGWVNDDLSVVLDKLGGPP
jgi:hypothetical protein